MFQIVCILIISALVFADQLIKHIVVNWFADNKPFDVLFSTFKITYVKNTGAAFSMFSSNTVILTVFTCVIIIFCFAFLMLKKSPSRVADASLILIISGGIGNVIDRIANGFVVDYIEPLFVKFAVFNFADICITVGAFVLIIYEIVTALNDKGAKNAE